MSYYRSRYKPLDQMVDLTAFDADHRGPEAGPLALDLPGAPPLPLSTGPQRQGAGGAAPKDTPEAPPREGGAASAQGPGEAQGLLQQAQALGQEEVTLDPFSLRASSSQGQSSTPEARDPAMGTTGLLALSIPSPEVYAASAAPVAAEERPGGARATATASEPAAPSGHEAAPGGTGGRLQDAARTPQLSSQENLQDLESASLASMPALQSTPRGLAPDAQSPQSSWAQSTTSYVAYSPMLPLPASAAPAAGLPQIQPSGTPLNSRQPGATFSTASAAAGGSSGLRVRGTGEGRREGRRQQGGVPLEQERAVLERLYGRGGGDASEDKGLKHQPLPMVLMRVVRLWWGEQEWPHDVRAMTKAQLTTLSTCLMAFLLLFIALMLLSASGSQRRTGPSNALQQGSISELDGEAAEQGGRWEANREEEDAAAVWREQHPGSQQQLPVKGRVQSMHEMPPRDWLLHDPEDLLALANGSAFPRLATSPLQASPTHLPHTCWSIQERHLLYPSPAAPAAASASGRLQQSRGGSQSARGGEANLPSPALLEALRAYEKMHQECVAGVVDWSKHTEKLEDGRDNCRYVVWQEPAGNNTVGTRLLSLLSAFLYGLLTDRALLVRSTLDLDSLLCQPFPHSSWWARPKMLPEYFSSAPHQGEWVNGSTSNQGQQDTKRSDVVTVLLESTKYVWDMQFFCDSMQTQLAQRAVWLLFQSNQYLAPGLFLVDSFRNRLGRLFPSRVLLQPLARYLLHPSNAIWDRITRVYEGYLFPADLRVGVEVAVLGRATVDEKANQRVVECGMHNGLFPHPITSDQLSEFLNSTAAAMRHQSSASLPDDAEADAAEAALEDAFEREMRIRRSRRRRRGGASGRAATRGRRRLLSQRQHGRRQSAQASGARGTGWRGSPRALLGRMRRVLSIFVSSSSLTPYIHLKTAFGQRPMEDHSLVTVHSESVEEQEESRVLSPQQKELAEIWLLSMADALLTSYMSGAGYLASGLAGKVPFTMNIVDWEEEVTGGGGNLSVHNSWKSNNKPVCERAWAAEACFLAPPASLMCSSDPRGDGSNGTSYFFRQSTDPSSWLPFVRRCQDYAQGLTIIPKFRFPGT